MTKKKEITHVIDVNTEEYMKYLRENPEMTLEIDPDNKYNMSDDQKNFIKNYIQFKSIPLAAELSKIDLETAKAFFVAYSTQNEIRRVNSILCKIQFGQKMMSLDDIGGYLTSLIIDNDIPVADRLKTVDKLKVIKMLIDLHVLKTEAVIDPSVITDRDIEADIKELSVDTIKQLLYTNNIKENNDKNELIEKLNIDNVLSAEEIDYLKTLSTKELLELIDLNTKEEK